MAICLHALPTFVLADFGLTTLFEITHGKQFGQWCLGESES